MWKLLILLVIIVFGYVFLIQLRDEQPVQNSLPEPQLEKNVKELKTFVPPISEYDTRITKKPFGVKISIEDSPVQPERFSGYHTGTDFEINEGELDQEVNIYSVCEGEIIQKSTVNGYGGVVIQRCLLDNQSITVIYGHVSLKSVGLEVGDKLTAGEKFAVLGKDKSFETDGERKHLHLGIHKGSSVEVRGYVQEGDELSQWVDIEDLLSI